MADQEETTAIVTVEQEAAEGGETENLPQYAEQESEAQVTVTVQPSAKPEPGVEFRDIPVWITDEKGNRIQTELRYKNGLLTWIAMLVLCLICSNFGLCFLCLVPLCMNSMKDVEHVNPSDGTVVGIFHRIQH